MNEKLIELFKECWNNNCDLADNVAIHNIYVVENNGGDYEIFDNDEDFMNTNFSNPMDAVRATYFGHYLFADDYVWFNGYANLDSGSYESDLPFEDIEVMAEWFIDNYREIEHIDAMDEFVDACKYGFDEEEDEEED